MGYFSEASKNQEQARSELNVDMDDVIHEQGHNVPVYANMSIKYGWIFLVKVEEVINNGKTSKILGFYAAKNWKKILQWSSLWIIFNGKINKMKVRCNLYTE